MNPQDINDTPCTTCCKFHSEDDMWGRDWDDKQCTYCYTQEHNDELKELVMEHGCSVDSAREILLNQLN